MGSRIGTKAKIRSAIIGAVDALAAFPVGAALLRRRFGTAHIRAINYHAFSRDLASGFERQLAFYAKHFDDCSRSDLDVLLSGSPETSSWSRPRLLISFDDGFSGQYEIAAPLLEKYGFTGWFFVPSWHIGRELDAPTSESGGIAGSFMSAAQLQELVARGHVVGCHTRHHTRLVATLSQEQLETEIVAARDDIEASIGGKIDVFCWVRGDEPSYSARAAQDRSSEVPVFVHDQSAADNSRHGPALPGKDQYRGGLAAQPCPLLPFRDHGFGLCSQASARRRQTGSADRLTAGNQIQSRKRTGRSPPGEPNGYFANPCNRHAVLR